MVVGVQYKVLFVGLGSIGKRHLKNLLYLKPECKVDALRHSGEEHPNISEVYKKYEDVPSDYDIIFITNPTSLHLEAVSHLASRGKHFFIEKPIFEKPYECVFSEGINYVACPLRHNSIIQSLKKYVETNKVFSFRAVCSSYLPEWRKNTDYRKSYSADSSMGGGVELDLIHEIDYLRWIFKDFSEVKKIITKKSDLEISSNDVAVYLLENENVVGSLHLDYFGRTSKRQVEVFSQKETVMFDILKAENDMYLDEMQYFLKLIENQPKSYYNSTNFALESLKMALL